ncbi:MAG TPA: chorismate synthase [Vulgatibacter sp.]|nr:chorismate synthase [Vulgatibacter sp.]
MNRLRFLTAGESHGPALCGILEGLPSGLLLEAADLDRDLARRQKGHGRGGRMKIERDAVEILGGVRFGRTLGSPLAVLIRNRDHANWAERMQVAPGGPDDKPVTVPRPGHADLAGGLKYGHVGDLRNVLERASARETATRVALGAAARTLLREFGIGVGSYVCAIGGVTGTSAEEAVPALFHDDAEGLGLHADGFDTRAVNEASNVRFIDEIDEARRGRDTLGGVVEVVVTGLPVGLGSHVHWDRKLDGRLARALMSIPAIKSVEVGDGVRAAELRGSEVHDPIQLMSGRLSRSRNRAGGLEGGITNGEPLVVRAYMKPIATMPAALDSVDLHRMEERKAHVERSDTCAVPAAGVVAEAMVALALADALLEAVGGDTLESMRQPFARMRLAARAEVGHVFLLGPMGSGKTRSGLILARRLERPFIDLDATIERRSGMSIAEIFRHSGEEGFRELEEAALADVVSQPPSVIALGGGAVTRESAWRRIRGAGVAFHLHAEPEELARRLTPGDRSLLARPLLGDGDPLERLRALSASRERWYAKADLRLETTGASPEEVAGAALGLLRTIEGPLATRGR